MLKTTSNRITRSYKPGIRSQRAIVKKLLGQFTKTASLYTQLDEIIMESNPHHQITREIWQLNKSEAMRVFGWLAPKILPAKIEGQITECFYGSCQGWVDGKQVEFTPLTGRRIYENQAIDVLRGYLQKKLTH